MDQAAKKSPQPPIVFRDLFQGLSWRPVGWDINWDRVFISEWRTEVNKILRSCWVTPAWVWRLAEQFTGPAQCDPFWNPWSRVFCPEEPPTIVTPMCASTMGRGWPLCTVLDGAGSPTGNGSKYDGFDAQNWRGTSLVNGPWSCPKKWLSLCAEHGKANNVAAVCKAAVGDSWFHDFVWSADLIIFPAKRIQFVSPWPETVKSSSAPGGSVIPLWLPSPRRIPTLSMNSVSWVDVSRFDNPIWPKQPVDFEFEGRQFTLVRGRGTR